jgi:hydrogenase nickel incorporation protein HypA/HybF
MHEMAVTQAMLNMALEYADGQRITGIYLRVGSLSAIVPESVQMFFDYLSRDTLAEGAALHFEVVPIEMVCLDCGRQADLDEWAGEPPRAIVVQAQSGGCECGSKRLRISGGMGFDMVSIAVQDIPG